MIKTYYIDAYNVMHKMPHISSMYRAAPDAARQALIDRIASWLPRAAAAVVVFDGDAAAKPDASPRIKFIFSRVRTADAVIRAEIEKHTVIRSLAVVSSDAEVAHHARVCGATIITAESFAAQTASASNTNDERFKETPVSRSEVDEWLHVFTSDRPKR